MVNTKRDKRENQIKRVFGDEPMLSDYPYNDPKLGLTHAFNWYSNNPDITYLDKMEYIYTWMKNDERYVEFAEDFKNLPQNILILDPVSAICRMLTNGQSISPKYKKFLYTRLEKFISKVSERKQNDKRGNFRVNIVNALITETDKFLEEFELAIDEVIKNGKTSFSVYNYLKSNNINRKVTNNIRNNLFERITEVINASVSNEEWETYSKVELAKLKMFYKSVLADLDLYLQNAKQISENNKVNKDKKKIVVTKKVDLSKFIYLKEFPELKLVSIDPSKSIGAKYLWVYNIEYKTLGYYLASDDKGLELKGTSIHNFNEEKSFMKRLRKPEDVVPTILNSAEKKCLSIFSEIKTVESNIRSRISDKVILLKVFK
jgi:hypothetical protein